MIILILAEPRSGSTNLAKWFNYNKNFTVLQEPLNKNGLNFKKNVPPHEWPFETEHLLIKEIYTPDINLKELINLADKIILLYRIDIKEQMESWLVAAATNEWSSEWIQDRVYINHYETRVNYFKKLKDGFKKDFIDSNTYFKISYEELYYNNGFQKIVDYINLHSIKNENFPYGKKYRINNKPNKLI